LARYSFGVQVFFHIFIARQHSIHLARYMLIARPSVCLSVCHTGGSYKNRGWS